MHQLYNVDCLKYVTLNKASLSSDGWRQAKLLSHHSLKGEKLRMVPLSIEQHHSDAFVTKPWNKHL